MKVLVQPVNCGWQLGVARTLDLTVDQADGRACLVCGERGGPMRPVALSQQAVQLFAHELCVHETVTAHLADLHEGAPA